MTYFLQTQWCFYYGGFAVNRKYANCKNIFTFTFFFLSLTLLKNQLSNLIRFCVSHIHILQLYSLYFSYLFLSYLPNEPHISESIGQKEIYLVAFKSYNNQKNIHSCLKAASCFSTVTKMYSKMQRIPLLPVSLGKRQQESLIEFLALQLTRLFQRLAFLGNCSDLMSRVGTCDGMWGASFSEWL